ncbi:L-lysine dehydrogenase [Heyndrickxia shackletonii]|uniref:L-lysine dehydrogenase n=1 Tax=Heyndrickxia shackletonii TaxID=157838 RepID=A0A0Q3WVL2_9BACI|nr:saccharopine dehydrogenase C-terminal domain-containing protein [Heyndrickxia shackletonii]KQL52698.1 L-lysine dehydrogenase [Heyndrickxia shackletonii]NEZ01728.1 L-lysine dehydrogenase [Heyndrickxia shackletonii]
MLAVVLGTGMIGTTVVKELASCSVIHKVTAVDAIESSVTKCLEIAENKKVEGKVADLHSEEAIYEVLKGADVAIACLPHSLSLSAVKAAISAKCHLVDLVGSQFERKLELEEEAKAANVLVVPGCGVAPGITNFLAAQGIEMLDEADEAIMICGGIPKDPLPPLWYQVVFRLESVMGLYTRSALAVENGELIRLEPLSGLERLSFPEPVGDCEAVITDAHSTAYTLRTKVNNLYEKTVRYPEHWSKMKTLAELGFLDEKPIVVEGIEVSPRKMTEAILAPQLKGKSNEDITVVRVTVKGIKNGKPTEYEWEMVDFYDHNRNITSMAKTTSIPAMLMAKWIAEGKIGERGIVPPESIIVRDRFHPFIEELAEYGIHFTFTSK